VHVPKRHEQFSDQQLSLIESTPGKESTFTICLPELTPLDILTLENTNPAIMAM